jgi:hypothetical protein
VPKGIAQIEKAIFWRDVFAFFKRTFAVGGAVERATEKLQAVFAVKGAFRVENALFYLLHT